MFLTKQHIFSDEFIEQTQMHRANISMARNHAEAHDCFETIKKIGKYSFINTTSPLLPNYISQHISTCTFTNMENLLPKAFVKKEFKVSDEDIDRLIKTTTEFKGIKTLVNIEFVEFDKDFVQKLNNAVPYILNKKDLHECISSHLIDGYISLNNKSHLSWYNYVS